MTAAAAAASAALSEPLVCDGCGRHTALARRTALPDLPFYYWAYCRRCHPGGGGPDQRYRCPHCDRAVPLYAVEPDSSACRRCIMGPRP